MATSEYKGIEVLQNTDGANGIDYTLSDDIFIGDTVGILVNDDHNNQILFVYEGLQDSPLQQETTFSIIENIKPSGKSRWTKGQDGVFLNNQMTITTRGYCLIASNGQPVSAQQALDSSGNLNPGYETLRSWYKRNVLFNYNLGQGNGLYKAVLSSMDGYIRAFYNIAAV